MKGINKFFSAVVIVSLLCMSAGSHIALANASNSKNLIMAKYKLKETPSGSNYIRQIDILIQKYRKNTALLTKLQTRSRNVLNKFPNPSTTSEKQIVAIMDYLNMKTDLALENIQILEQEQQEQQERAKEMAAENKLESLIAEIKAATLSVSDTKIVNNKIVQIQKTIYEHASKNLITLRDEINQYSNAKQSGDMSLDANIKIDGNSLDFKALFNNYEVISNNFDAKAKTDIDIFFEMVGSNPDEKEKIQMTGNIDMINKDSQMYMLLQDMVRSGEGEMFTEMEEVMKVFITDNKYIKIPNLDLEEISELLDALNLNTLLEQAESISENPLLEAYKKEGNTYFLAPSRFACQTAKENLYQLYSYLGKNCSESEYNDLLKEFFETGTLTLEISGNTSNLIFKTPEVNISLSFTDTQVLELYLEIDDSDSNTLLIDYKNNNNLDIIFSETAYDGVEKLSMTSQLNNKNQFTQIDAKYDFVAESEWQGNTNATLTLNNGQITGEFTSQEKYYDYDSRSYIDATSFTATVNGRTDYNNSLDTLSITMNDGEDFKGNMKYENKTLSGNIENINENEAFTFDFSGTYNTSQDIMTDGFIDVVYKEKKSEYDNNTYERIYSGELNELFVGNLKIQNKNITGNMQIQDQTETFFSMNMTGEYTKDSSNIDLDFTVKNPYALYTPDDQKSDNDMLKGNMTLQTDTSNNISTIDMSFKVLDTQGEINIEANLKNKSSIEYGDFTISAPSDYINFDALLEQNTDM